MIGRKRETTQLRAYPRTASEVEEHQRAALVVPVSLIASVVLVVVVGEVVVGVGAYQRAADGDLDGRARRCTYGSHRGTSREGGAEPVPCIRGANGEAGRDHGRASSVGEDRGRLRLG